LHPATEGLDPLLEPKQRADDSAHDHRGEHDEQWTGRTDLGDPGLVEDVGDVEGGNDQGDEAERLHDELARALRKSIADKHPESRTDDNRRHVEQSP
jgi:hypothetical protein